MKHDLVEPIRVPLGPEPHTSNALLLVVHWDQTIDRDHSSGIADLLRKWEGVTAVESRLV